MSRPFIAIFQLTDSEQDSVRARFADDNVFVHRETSDLWHLSKEDGTRMTFWLLGETDDGDQVHYVISEAQGRNFLRGRIGGPSKVVPLVAAWRAAAPRAYFGGLTTKAWLLTHGFRETTGEGNVPAGSPIPPLVLCGYNPIAFAQRVVKE